MTVTYNAFDPNAYLKPYYDETTNEIGFRVGIPVLQYEISKQPEHWIKKTKYNEEKIHNFKLDSIAQDGLVVSSSYQWKTYTDNFFTGGRWKTGEINADISALLELGVSSNSEVTVKEPPFILSVNSSTSGLFQIPDFMGHALTFIATGGEQSFGFFDLLGGVGALAYDFTAAFTQVSVGITDPIQRSLVTDTVPDFIRDLYQLDDTYGDVYLEDIRYDAGGAYMIFSYPERLEAFIEDLLLPVSQGFQLAGLTPDFGNLQPLPGDGIWFGVFNEGDARNGYSHSGKWDTFTQQISDYWADGYDLIDVEYGDGVWFGVFQDTPGSNAYSTRAKLTDFTDTIEGRWDQGYDLVEVEYGDGIWFGVFHTDAGRNGYSHADTLTNFKEQIKDKWDDGFDLVDIEYGDGVWFGVYQDSPGTNGYSHSGNLETFKEQVQDRWDQGYDLVDLEYGDGIYFGVFQKTASSPINGYSHRGSLEGFTEAISGRWDQDFLLSEVSFLPSS